MELAKDIGADGVHVGQSAIIGVTAKTVQQAMEAQKQGAVFSSNTKLDAKPMEHVRLQEICEAVTILVVAIGGITKENVSALKSRGMSGIAIIGGIFGQEDITQATIALKRTIEEII